jgi:hypothetical protein
MLDRESEIYNSGVLAQNRPDEYAAVVLTRDGVEVSAASRGFSLHYSSTWEQLRKRWSEIDRNTRHRGIKVGVPLVMEN